MAFVASNLAKPYTIQNSLVLVICISKYKDERYADLEGPVVDMKNLINLWQNTFHFKVISNNSSKSKDLFISKNDLLIQLDEARIALRKNDTFDSFIFIYSGHGYDQGIITGDGQKTTMKDIKQHFSVKNIPNFKDKPKTYIIDACRSKIGFTRK